MQEKKRLELIGKLLALLREAEKDGISLEEARQAEFEALRLYQEWIEGKKKHERA